VQIKEAKVRVECLLIECLIVKNKRNVFSFFISLVIKSRSHIYINNGGGIRVINTRFWFAEQLKKSDWLTRGLPPIGLVILKKNAAKVNPRHDESSIRFGLVSTTRRSAGAGGDEWEGTLGHTMVEKVTYSGIYSIQDIYSILHSQFRRWRCSHVSCVRSCYQQLLNLKRVECRRVIAHCMIK